MPKLQGFSAVKHIIADKIEAETAIITTVVGNVVNSGYTIDTAGAATVTATQLVEGFSYIGAAGGAVALQLPTATLIIAELLSKNVVAATGVTLPPTYIDVTDANTLTVTTATGITLAGTPQINNNSATINYIFTSATAITATIVANAAPIVSPNYTISTADQAGVTITAAELIDGYFATSASGVGNLTLPTAASVQTELLARGIVSAAGVALKPTIVDNTAAANLTLVANTGNTIVGQSAILNAEAAVLYYVFTAAATASVAVIGVSSA
jgi:hypothetical protein